MKKFFVLIASAVMIAACAGKPAAVLDGKWKIVSACAMSTEGSETEPYITFENGRVNGNASVNSFFGDYIHKGDSLSFATVGMTRKMGESMEIEMAITDAINNCALIKIDGDTAVIYDANDNELMRLAR